MKLHRRAMITVTLIACAAASAAYAQDDSTHGSSQGKQAPDKMKSDQVLRAYQSLPAAAKNPGDDSSKSKTPGPGRSDPPATGKPAVIPDPSK